MKLTKQLVYLPVKVEHERNMLQEEIDYWYEQTGSPTSETIVKRAYSLGLGKGIQAQEGYFFTEEQLKSLQDIVDEGYSAYDTAHHLQVQSWLEVIKTFLNEK